MDEVAIRAVRLDTQHRIYYPTRHFGFLNVTPRVGYQGTKILKIVEEGYLVTDEDVPSEKLKDPRFARKWRKKR